MNLKYDNLIELWNHIEMINVIYLYEWFEKYKFLKKKSYFEIVFKVFEIFGKILYVIWNYMNYFGNVYKYFPIFCDKGCFEISWFQMFWD